MTILKSVTLNSTAQSDGLINMPKVFDIDGCYWLVMKSTESNYCM